MEKSPLLLMFAPLLSDLPNVVELIIDDEMGPPAIRIEIKKSSFSCGGDAKLSTRPRAK